MKLKPSTMVQGAGLLLGLAFLLTVLGEPCRAQTAVAYFESFDGTNGGYTTGANSSWAWGTPSTGPGGAHSGAGAWATNPHGNYWTNEDSYLTSPPIDLNGFTNHEFVLSWWQYLVTEPDYDVARVEVSHDGGGNWVTAYGDVSGDVNLFWTRQTARLGPDYATGNFRMRFHLGSDGTVNRPGFYVDDIQVRALTVRSNSSEALTLYREEFESGPGGFTVGGVSSWEWGGPEGGPAAPRSGTNVWATTLAGFYEDNEDGWLVSPPLDLSAHAGKAFTLSWWQYLVTEADCDFACVEVSRDGWATSKVVYGPVSGAVSETWMNPSVRLDSLYATSHFQLRFRLRSDESLGHFGFYVDNVELAVVMDPMPLLSDAVKVANVNDPMPITDADFNDHFSSPDSLVVVRIASLPANGILRLRGELVTPFQEIPRAEIPFLTYHPGPGYAGPDGFEWNGSDFLFYSSANARFNISVTAPPVPGPDTGVTLQNTPVCLPTASLLNNDTDPEGSILRILAVSTPSAMGGGPSFFGGIVYYRPPPDFLGSDSFSYVLADAQGGTATGMVMMTVAPAPVEKITPPNPSGTNNWFYQVVRVSNPLTTGICGTMNGVQVMATNLPVGCRLANPSGTNSAGLPYVAYTNALSPGQSADLTIAYRGTNAAASTNAILFTLVIPPGPAAGSPQPATINRALKRPDGSFLLEFTSEPECTYTIQFSSDLVAWTTVSGAVVAPSGLVQWIDDPPAQFGGSSVGATNRFYRVLVLPDL